MNKDDQTNRELIEEISSLKVKIRELKKKEADLIRDREGLRESQNKYQIILSQSPDPTFSFTREGQYTFVNKAFALGVGKPLEDIIGKTIWDVFPKEEADKRFTPLSQVFRTGMEKVIEVRVPRADGDRYYITTITPIKDAKGDTLSAICSSKDITERKRMETELQDRETQMRILFEYSGTAVIIIEDDMMIDLANQEFADRVGYTREEIEKRKKWTQFVDEKDLQWMVAQHDLRRAASEKASNNYEFRFKSKSGELRDTLLNINLIPGTRKSIASLIDITDRKQAEEALRESEARFRAQYQNNPIPTFTWRKKDDTFILEDFNTAATLMTNGEAVKYLNKTPDEMYGKQSDILGDMQRCYADKIVLHREIQSEHFMSGRTIVATCTFVPPDLVMVHIKDITLRRHAEEALRESEARFRTQYQNNPMSTFTWQEVEDNFILKDFNIAASVLTKGDAAKYVNMTARDMYQDRPDILADMYRCYNNKTIVQKELRSEFFKRPRIMIATWSYVPPDLLIAYLEDITDRRQAEQERNRLQVRLQQAEKMEALGTLAGGVAHDLNNVLGILVGYSELLLIHVPEGNPLRGHVEKIMKGGVRAAAIVQDLLTLARRGVHAESVVNLNAVITDFQKTPEFENLHASSPNVHIEIKLDEDLLNIKGSSSHISKTFMNLLTNALEAMPRGGRVTVTTGNRNLDTPVHGYDDIREGDYVMLAVSDDGEGITDEDLKHIFEPFYTKKVMGRSGTGLGLAVVWGTVKDHKGYIDVQSEKGRGTTVFLYFPVTREELSASPAAVPLSDYIGKDESILVVDDIREQRELASMILGNLNYRVTTAASGEEAIEYLRSHQADLIILDMIMDPGMDGLDTFKRILEIRPKQKTVIVSGFSESNRVQAAQALGAGAYLRKPYIMEKLGVTVRKELDRNAQR